MSDSIQPRLNDLVPMPWWATECLFWIGFCFTSFVSLSLFYGQPNFFTFADLGFEAVMGTLFTRPILWSAPKMRSLTLIQRIGVLLLLIVICSQLWNLVRMVSFPYFFPGAYIWNQFGGWAFSAILIFSAWTALFYSMRAYKLAAAQRELADHEHLRRLEAEQLSSAALLKMLRYQINPHFIFNTLNSINALVATNRNQDARKMIEGFSGLLRRTLEADPRLIVPLTEELDTVTRFLEVERMRFGARLEFQVNLDPDIANTPVPSLLIQPIAENAVRHGVEAQATPCRITIDAKRKGNLVEIKVTDTGPGVQAHAAGSHHSGIGLHNIRARLQSVYQTAASLALSPNQPSGTQATLLIPADLPENFR